MYDPRHSDRYDYEAPGVAHDPPPTLPQWLAKRLLLPDETITWVVGPRFQPSWERGVTNPLLFVICLAIGGLWIGTGFLIPGAPNELKVSLAVAAGFLVLGSIFVLGIFSGYFTRLVVTTQRLLLVQGREVYRRYAIDDLPYSMIRYRIHGDHTSGSSIDLDAVKSMLGGSSDQFAEAKSILAFSKQLDRLRDRNKGRPEPPNPFAR
jgi:hypothetical protein